MVRFKNRYIAFEITPGDKSNKPLVLKATTLYNVIQKKVQQLYGDFGQAAIKAGFNVLVLNIDELEKSSNFSYFLWLLFFTAKYCNTHTRIALVKVRHGPHKFLLDSIPLIKDLAGRLVSVKILYTGATMKHCFLFIKRYQQKKLEETWNSLRNDIERREMENALMTLTPAMKEFR